ncbi:mismatch-specific DNA-glycosylase [Serinibacter arcticus]|uniref:Mismatch-specific DNA-glycosylase n=1 Tax=Serinibacter arcticus TaxID=1655435 RepID=A0A2U1ZWL6_9MICO|nr:mismatch-specific DNA-glycosylase [Serinibacter arcticus]PWD51371.1 mismatch-specific DNA-glycosylase [Serinibacter arcticus]
MPRPTREELAAALERTADDLVPPRLRLLFVGINPSPWTAAVGAHFARPGNRFYPALAAAGIVPEVIDASEGYRPQDRALLEAAGVGVSNLVRRATARADELTREELRAGAERLERDVAGWRPAVVAVLGVTAYREGFARPRAAVGKQEETLGGAELWVVPNPSGLNAHESVASLATAYAAPARAAGVIA